MGTSRKLAVLCLTASLVAAACAIARADGLPGATNQPAQDPGPTCEAVTGSSTGCDNGYTPVAKDGCAAGWTQVSGAVFPGAKPCGSYNPAASDIPATVDLYAVSFINGQHGLAGGATCADSKAADDPSTPADELEQCVRVPVIYSYGADPEGVLHWREVMRGSTPGYVGAVAWLSRNRALAVGGSGCYPKREDPALCPPGQRPPTDAPDPISGAGRAWVASDGNASHFEGVPLGSGPTSGITGMDAVASTPRVSECQAREECAIAGGLRQLWIWSDGSFSTSFTPATATNNGQLWRYRVRQVAIPPDPQTGASAYTAGCCAPADSPTQPQVPSRLQIYSGSLGVSQLSLAPQPVLGSDATTLTDHGAVAPDSVYAAVAETFGTSLLFAPGGPEHLGEPSSYVAGSGAFSQSPASSMVLTPRLGSVRLVAGGTDNGTHPNYLTCSTGGICGGGADGVMDWAVGELRSTRPAGSSGQAVAFSTLGRGSSATDAPSPVKCPPGDSITSATITPSADCRPASDIDQQSRSGDLFALPSYALNAFGASDASGGVWAVGDHGATMHLGSEATSQLPPERAPKLGAHEKGSGANSSSYSDLASGVTDHPGRVPALAEQPRQPLGEQLVSYGSANPEPDHEESISAVAMSRDGEEGWAVGADAPNKTMTLQHFAQGRWSDCNFAADPACSRLTALRAFNISGARIMTIARVPLEYDSDPSNDESFEAVAIATPAPSVTHSPNDVVLRYLDGRWKIDQPATDKAGPLTQNPADTVTQMAFSGPKDGWLVETNAIRGTLAELLHFDGEAFAACTDGATVQNGRTESHRVTCEDPGSDADASEAGDQGLFPVTDYFGPFKLATAGSRVYLYGNRWATGTGNPSGGGSGTGDGYPFILANDPGPCDAPRQSGCWQSLYDPKASGGGRGRISALSVAEAADGSFNGWAVGAFNLPPDATQGNATLTVNPPNLNRPDDETALLHSGEDGLHWGTVASSGAAADYLLPPLTTQRLEVLDPVNVVALPGEGGKGPVLVAPSLNPTRASFPMVWRDPATGSWTVFPTPWAQIFNKTDNYQQGVVEMVTSDGADGLWVLAKAVIGGRAGGPGTFFYRYSPREPAPVFAEIPQPIQQVVTAAASGPNGDLWVTTESSTVYRYDRVTGWDQIRIPGWDAGRIATRPSPANAIAIGPDGRGLVVGRAGRIADVSPDGVALDEAAGILCSTASRPSGPCGTGRDLQAVSIADDGSALAGGDDMALLWRPANGQFRSVKPPPAVASATITGISLPTGDRAWVVTSTGDVYSGTLAEGAWHWHPEARDESGDTLSRVSGVGIQPLRAVALDRLGNGFAVGDRGMVLKRSEGAWHPLDTGFGEDLRSIALAGSASNALVGGVGGLILSYHDGHFLAARNDDSFDPLTFARVPGESVVGVALVPGEQAGDVEAWAAIRGLSDLRNGVGPAILHYTSAASSSELDGGVGRAHPLGDVPAPSSKSLTFAAFGRSECQLSSKQACPELTNSGEANDVIARRIRDAVISGPDTADIALFTGDVGEIAGDRNQDPLSTDLDTSRIHRRWVEEIADPLSRSGVPVFAAIGGQDLSNPETCDPITNGNTYCVSRRGLDSNSILGVGPEGPDSKVGSNLPWRQAMAEMPPPWGTTGVAARPRGGFEIAPVSSGQPSFEPGNQSVGESAPDPTGRVGDQSIHAQLPLGGAHTHYAFDVTRDGDPVTRVVVVDTSLRSLSASNAQQNPVQEQLAWMREVLSSRPRGERAIVVSNTPTYSFGPGVGTDTETDAAAFEQALVDNHVDAAVSGRLGWNGVYWTCAAGLHYPGPGAAQPNPNEPPADSSKCAVAASSVPDATSALPSSGTGASAPIPTLIAATAGGKFGVNPVDSNTATSDGYWHGYSTIRLDLSGAEPAVIAERPVFDWLALSGSSHVARPGQSIRLSATGREPMGIDVPFRYDSITSPAITHCYDLVLADPGKPWLPLLAKDASKSDLAKGGGQGCQSRSFADIATSGGVGAPDGNSGCAPYACVSSSIATVDGQTGEVHAGGGQQQRTYTLAVLSVGDKVATYPIAFEPRPSFRGAQVAPVIPQPPSSAPPPAPAPPAPVPPFNPPVLQAPPALPPLPSQTPPTPPVPPAPPNGGPAQLDLFTSPPVLSVAPSISLFPPSPPVINVAPPTPARPVEKAKKVAVQSSGSDSDAKEGAGETAHMGGDMAGVPDSPHGAAMTRHENNFTALAHRDQPSAWARDLQWGGGLTLMALVLAFGWITVRPGPRRRTPEVPAPEWTRGRNR
jgi:hypothetical protein